MNLIWIPLQAGVRAHWLIICGITLLAAAQARAATITVQSTADGAANAANCPGPGCRLRDALAAANSGDTINFSVTGTITLNSGELSIARNLTITGPGAPSLTIDGNASTRVFYIAPNLGVSISGLTIANGKTGFGGALYNDHSNVAL